MAVSVFILNEEGQPDIGSLKIGERLNLSALTLKLVQEIKTPEKAGLFSGKTGVPSIDAKNIATRIANQYDFDVVILTETSRERTYLANYYSK